jgi:peptidoglycan/LPS O-acetylase OafA/YrhL
VDFRTDINGLRAIAVLLVVLFHFSIPGFSGGFIGVDVFFVISGYLMTAIIFNRIDKNTFSAIDFYLARAKRIIPALLVLCMVLLTIHWFIMTPSEYTELGEQTAAASLFLSNILFWQGSGYFDSSAHEKWLLHTWSLSVEWQFYILYPIGLLILIRLLGRKNIGRYLLFAAVASYLLSAFLPIRWQDAGFYLLPTRAWEMLAGGLIFLFPLRISQLHIRYWELIGLLLILVSGFLLSPMDRWPGWLGIFPVIGSALVIYANQQSSHFTNNWVMQHLGNISYSLYLWHWPFVVALHYFQLNENPVFILIGILCSWVVALLSYRFVESPIRHWQFQKSRLKNISAYAIASFFIAGLAFSIILNKGIPSRLDPLVVIADSDRFNTNPRWQCNMTPLETLEWRRCIYGNQTDKVALIVAGDSHSNAVITAAAESIPINLGGAVFLGADACPFTQNFKTTYYPACEEYNRENIAWLKKNHINTPLLIVNRITATLYGSNEETIRPVVSYIKGISSNDPEYVDTFIKEYADLICEMAKYHPTYLLEPIPEMGVNVPNQLSRNIRFHNNPEVKIPFNSYEQRHKLTKQLHQKLTHGCGVKILDPVPYLCDDNYCYGSEEGRSLYFDDDHLSEFGNRRLIPLFQSIWKQ